MIRPNRHKPPNPVAMSQQPKVEPLKHKCGHDIQFHYRGATAEPCQACRVANATPVPDRPRPDTHTGEPTGKPRPVIPRDPDGTHYESFFYEKPTVGCKQNGCEQSGPHHHSAMTIYAATFRTTGPSLFENFRELKRQLEAWRAAQKGGPTP